MSTTLTFYGQASFGVETAGFKLVIDPFFTGNPLAPISAEEVEADYLLVSHGHGDHIGDTIPIVKRTGAKVITTAEIAGWLGKQDIEAHPQHIGGGFHHPFGYLKFTQAFHGSGLPDGSYGGMPAGFLLTTKADKKIYFAQDTGLFGDMKLYGDEGLDVAFLPIGDNFTMGPDDALRAVKLLRPKTVVPMHYNTWPLIEQDPQAWAERVRAQTDSKVIVMQPGETLEV
ncbi:MAG: metal-dependent hydrolase [Anaerolineales bacterium]|nr:metal-dependent hydrolase [Anaerolineales bacterium]